eukprot:jgi/Galph1/2544/GphlegSOOS_G1208.1
MVVGFLVCPCGFDSKNRYLEVQLRSYRSFYRVNKFRMCSSTSASSLDVPKQAKSSSLNSLDKQSEVYYFAYGANISPTTFGPKATNSLRRVKVLEAIPGRLEGYRLIFNVRGIPLFEQSFANIIRDPNQNVQGVLYKLTKFGYKRILRSEGVGIPGVYEEVSVRVEASKGQVIWAKTLIANGRFFTYSDEVTPSSRYLKLLSDGAKHWGFSLEHPFFKTHRVTESQLKNESVKNPPFAVINSFSGSLPQDLLEFSSVAYWESGDLRFITVPDDASEMNRFEHCSSKTGEGSESLNTKLKPVLFYLPGIDGTGFGILPQLESLRKYFSVRCLVWPTEKRSLSWEQLQQTVATLIKKVMDEEKQKLLDLHLDEHSIQKPWLVAESMGCCLALLLARDSRMFEQVTLVNAATSYSRSAFSRVLSRLDLLPSFLYNIAPVAISPLLIDLNRQISKPEKLLRAAQGLTKLAEILPQDTLRYRIELIKNFPLKDADLRCLDQKFFIIAAVNDLLIPSHEESERLCSLLKRSVRYLSSFGGHGLLLEQDIVLSQLLIRSNELLTRFESMNPANGKSYTLSSVSEGNVEKDIGTVSQSLLSPSKNDIDKAQGQLDIYTKIVSPIFVGVDRVPETRDRPILFVGNHTLYGITDVPFFINHFLSKRNLLVRALAHPIFWNVDAASLERRLFHLEQEHQVNTFKARDKNTEKNGHKGTQRETFKRSSWLVDLMERFGALPVSPQNLYRLLSMKQPVLLFPGGAREAFKRKDEAYSLHWPSEAEFVRMAVRHDAFIVPFSCIGPEDNFHILLDGEEMIRLPLVGRLLEELFSRSELGLGDTVREWKGQMKKKDIVNFIQPISLPTVPHRLYFYFSPAIDCREHKAALKDRTVSQELYSLIRQQVKMGMTKLLKSRKEDPYGDFLKRVVFESVTGVTAPTVWKWSRYDGYLDVE